MDLEALRAQARTSMRSGGSTGDEAPWHKWSDSPEVIGELQGVETFTKKDGEEATYALVNTAGGPVKVGLDYAVLRSEWSKHRPEVGDTLVIMRGEEKATSQSGREFWPFGVSVFRKGSEDAPPSAGDSQLGIVVLEDQVVKRVDPDDDLPF
jgi:hypothetical protein